MMMLTSQMNFHATAKATTTTNNNNNKTKTKNRICYNDYTYSNSIVLLAVYCCFFLSSLIQLPPVVGTRTGTRITSPTTTTTNRARETQTATATVNATVNATTTTTTSSDICRTTNNNTFTVKLDLFASELGYYTFEECGNQTQPTIGIIVGETYTFVQKDISNWMHPLGFAYYPDGAHDEKDELEPTIVPSSLSNSSSFCNETYTCPSPKYYIDNIYQGIVNTSDFGLDVYEPLFFHSPVEWTSYGTFSVQVMFDDPSYERDIFYFCHVHQYMSGRIKLLNTDGTVINPDVDEPKIDYEYDVPGPFDKTCGTYGLDPFQLPNKECPSHFVCYESENEDNMDKNSTTTTNDSVVTAEESVVDANRGGTEKNELFADCLDAMNCHMLSKITTGFSVKSDIALFIHQMVPHHQNAVNMAKSLLVLKNDNNNDDGDDDNNNNNAILNCTDITNEDDQQCVMEAILRQIINSQNHEIQIMLNYLKDVGIPEVDECQIEVNSSTIDKNNDIVIDKSNGTSPTSSPPTEDGSSSTRMTTTTTTLVAGVTIYFASLWM